MRIVHVSVARDLGPGPLRQLTYERDAATRLQGHSWKTLAYQDVARSDTGVQQVPFVFRAMFLRNIFFWIVVLSESRHCDLVLTRHIPFDPFGFIFSALVRNRVSIHHTKEIEELRLVRADVRGLLAATLEKFAGTFTRRFCRALIGVTPEIADYQKLTYAKPMMPALVYPNGVDERSIKIAGDERRTKQIEAVFMSGTFADWQGLDKLFLAARQVCTSSPSGGLLIHIIGSLNYPQRQELTGLSCPAVKFVYHGILAEDEYRQVFARCHLGFAALAIERKRLKQASTLKVRELLGSGLPVFSTHDDPAFPQSFAYYYRADNIDLNEVMRFGQAMQSATRREVRAAAEPFIAKHHAMRDLLDSLAPLVLR